MPIVAPIDWSVYEARSEKEAMWRQNQFVMLYRAPILVADALTYSFRSLNNF